MKRVAIIGSPGAGKSTLAKKLGALIGIKVIHLDSLFWQPGWIRTPKEEWVTNQIKLVEGPSWIIDGNYSSTLDIRLSAADTIIYLDMSRWLCLHRVIKRRIMYRNSNRSDMASDCPEHLTWGFLKYAWDYTQLERPKVQRKLDKLNNKQVVVLKNPQQVAGFLSNLRVVAN